MVQGTIAYAITGMSMSKVKTLVRDMYENKVLDGMSDSERYHVCLAKGILNLQSHNRFAPLMKDLMFGLKTEKQRKALEDFVNSDSKPGEEQTIPDLSSSNNELRPVTTEVLVNQLEKEDDTDPLRSEHLQSVEEILEQLSNPVLESICEDEELLRFFVFNEVTKLWKNVFAESVGGQLQKENENIKIVDRMRQERLTGKKFHDEVRNIFLSEYDTMVATTSKLPEGYSFRHKPNLMQRYVASKVYQLSHFANFSDTGAGKTLSAILASRVINSRMTLIVCPNDVVIQWRDQIKQAFPDDSIIVPGKEAFYAKYYSNKYQYLILNYDKFSQSNSKYLVSKLVKQKIDFIVLDEIHFIKKRDDSGESKRREVLGILLNKARERNKEIKTLGMSATPVINDLEEGKSLLAYITNKFYDDISSRPNIFNAMALHEKLSLISIRQMPEYKTNVEYREVNVVAVKPSHIKAKDLKRHPLLMEQILTETRIPEIIKRIEGKTIIYTEYVTGIVNEILVEAVKKERLTYIQYTGDTKDTLEKFIDPRQNIQVLIASRPISVGVDGLQEVCSNLIINTLPWTNAQFRQIIGRLHRIGQKHTVKVHIIKASISGYEYDEGKWLQIENKRMLADCTVDGIVPIGLLQSKEKMYNELVKWLERLERNEISTFNRRNLSMQLDSTQLEHAKRTISEFGSLNKQINNEYSQTTHERAQQDPNMLPDYLAKLDTTKTMVWGFNPVNIIADKINLGLNMPKHLVMNLKIGDFGCGIAELADLLQENKVYSFDHSNIMNSKIIACDIKDVSKHIQDRELDIAVFSLSLMGRNWRDYIAEASRCLESKGWLFIAETTNQLGQEGRLSDLKSVIKENGFDIDDSATQIRQPLTFLEARKR